MEELSRRQSAFRKLKQERERKAGIPGQEERSRPTDAVKSPALHAGSLG